MDSSFGIRAYQEADYGSMGKEKMVVLLYEKMIEHFLAAEVAAHNHERIEMTRRLNRAQPIVVELRNALDMGIGGDIARNLEALYDFVFHEGLAMLTDQSPEHARNCLRVLQPLLDAWRRIPPGTAERTARDRSQAAGPEPAPHPVETSSPVRTAHDAAGANPVDTSRLLSVSA